ncbi:MAG: YqeG family HAD IIIA-type phosphatase [Candidatus Bipolaricaulia bacterium]
MLPDEQLNSIFELDPQRLKELGKRGIIFDLDNTLGRRGARELEEQVLKLLSRLEEEGFSIGILSNSEGAERERLLAKLDGYPVYLNAQKPRRRGFRWILQEMGLRPEEVAMVGDTLFTDVWGAKRLGIYSILVRPVDSHEPSLIRLGRLIARLFLLGRKG